MTTVILTMSVLLSIYHVQATMLNIKLFIDVNSFKPYTRPMSLLLTHFTDREIEIY